MFSKYNIFTFSAVLIALSLFIYHFSSVNLPDRKIAQVSEKIYRNRVIEPGRIITDVEFFPSFEEVAKLKNARIVIADYDLIKRDFFQVRELTNAEIDDWLLKQVAYISKPQEAQTVVNTQIPTTGETRKAVRPPKYGRALVFEALDPVDSKTAIGVIDVKGSGSLKPQQKGHGNGLASLGECLREYQFENLIRNVLDDADLSTKTVGSYAVIYTGFDIIHEDGTTSPAGLYLRQAHQRTSNLNALLSRSDMAKLEKIFYRYGIDSGENIQATVNDDIVDFGHYVVKNDLPSTYLEKQIPFHLWGHASSVPYSPALWHYSQLDYPWNWSHELANSFVKKKVNRQDVLTHFQSLIDPVRERLTTFRIKDYALNGYQSSKDVENFLRRSFIEKNLFVIENIKENLLNKNKIKDPLWIDFEVLVQLTKNLELLPYDSEIEKLYTLIGEKSIKAKKGSKLPMPKELEALLEKVAKIPTAKNNVQNCLGLVMQITQRVSGYLTR